MKGLVILIALYFNIIKCFQSTAESTEFLENIPNDFCLNQSMPDIYNEMLNNYLNKNYINEDNLKAIKFLTSNCSPVIFIPGLLSSALEITIDCKPFINELKENNQNDYNFFIDNCKNKLKICKNENSIFTQKLWPNLNLIKNNHLSIISIGDINYEVSTKCLGYLMRFSNNFTSYSEDAYDTYTKDYNESIYNNDKVDPKDYNILNKYRSEYIKIKPYFGNKYNLKCGLGAVSDIGDIGEQKFSALNGYFEFYKNFERIGYKDGFNLAAVPYDFKESHCEKNSMFAKLLNKLVNLLYTNTNKKIVIIAHSYGNLNFYAQLMSNKNVHSKIEHWVNIAGPLLGSEKGAQLMTTGSKEFDSGFKFKVLKADIDLETQPLMTGFINVSYALLPKDYMSSIKSIRIKKKWKKVLKSKNVFDVAVMFDNHKKLSNDDYLKICNNDKKLSIYDIPYSGYDIPYSGLSLNKNNHVSSPYENPCKIYSIDNEICPYVQVLHSKEEIDNYPNYKRVNDCRVFKNAISYYLLDNIKDKSLNKKTHHDFFRKYIPLSIKDINLRKEAEIFSKTAINNEYYKCIEDLKYPDVDTTLIYNRSFQTRSAFRFTLDSNNNIELPHVKNSIYSSGDGSVSWDSSMFPYFKWKASKRKNKKSVNIVDYCSLVSDNKLNNIINNDLKIDNKKSKYLFLGCECIENGKYTNKFLETFSGTYNCNHVSMLGDSYIINYVTNIAISKKNKVFEDHNIFDNIINSYLSDKKVLSAVSNECSFIFEDMFDI